MICKCTTGFSRRYFGLAMDLTYFSYCCHPEKCIGSGFFSGRVLEVCLHRICGASGTLYIQATFRTTCCPQFYLRRTASVKRLRLARCSLLSFFLFKLETSIFSLSHFDKHSIMERIYDKIHI